jgi:hypothetical protein
MSQPLVISIPHGLGNEEATRRLKAGLATAQSQFHQVFIVQEEIWSGDRLQFRIAALAQTASVVSHAMLYNMIRVCHTAWHVDEPRGTGDHA